MDICPLPIPICRRKICFDIHVQNYFDIHVQYLSVLYDVDCGQLDIEASACVLSSRYAMLSMLMLYELYLEIQELEVILDAGGSCFFFCGMFSLHHMYKCV